MSAVADAIADIYALGHRNVLQAVAELSEDQLRWRPPRSNSIAFNLWHIARWADHMHSVVGAITPGLRERLGTSGQIWTRDQLSLKWRFPPDGLGTGETGMGMDENASAELPLPPKAASAAEYGTVANWIISGIRHESRHLGMIEALKGAVGLRGTVTR